MAREGCGGSGAIGYENSVPAPLLAPFIGVQVKQQVIRGDCVPDHDMGVLADERRHS